MNIPSPRETFSSSPSRTTVSGNASNMRRSVFATLRILQVREGEEEFSSPPAGLVLSEANGSRVAGFLPEKRSVTNFLYAISGIRQKRRGVGSSPRLLPHRPVGGRGRPPYNSILFCGAGVPPASRRPTGPAPCPLRAQQQPGIPLMSRSTTLVNLGDKCRRKARMLTGSSTPKGRKKDGITRIGAQHIVHT